MKEILKKLWIFFLKENNLVLGLYIAAIILTLAAIFLNPQYFLGAMGCFLIALKLSKDEYSN